MEQASHQQPLQFGFEYDELENNNPQQDIRERLENDSRNAWLAHKLSFAVIIISIFAFILTLQLYLHHSSRTFFWHCFWLLITFGAAIYSLMWASRAQRAIDFGRDPVPIQSAAVFVVTAFLVVINATSAVWFFLYKPLHYAFMHGVAKDETVWTSKFGTRSYQEIWDGDSSRFNWIIFISFITVILFFYIAYASRTIHNNKYNLTRTMIYVMLGYAIFACWMTIYWSKEALVYTTITPKKIGGNTSKGLKIAAILALLLTVGNGLTNLHKRKTAYFIFGALLVVHLTITVCMAGKLIRDTREACFVETFSTTDCITTMVSIHEDNLSRFCPVGSKYLPNGEVCRKKDLVARWENKLNPNELRYANPGCCDIAKFFYVRPSMEMAHWSMVIVVCFLILAIMNIFLSGFEEGIFGMNRPGQGTDTFSIIATVCVLMTFVLYYFAMPDPSIRFGTNPQVMSYINPTSYPIRNLDLVHEKIRQRGLQDLKAGECFGWHPDVYPMPVMDSNDATCSTDCVHRVAIWIVYGEMKPSKTGGVYTNDSSSRVVFFPGCSVDHGNYYYFYGGMDEIEKALSESKLCGKVKSLPMTIYIYHDQQVKGTLNQRGLTDKEENSIRERASKGSAAPAAGVCMGGFEEGQICQGSCKIFFNTAKVGILSVMKGKLYYIQNDTVKHDIHPNIIIEAYHGKTKVGGNINIYEGGIFAIESIMRLYEYDYILTLVIIDPLKVFQNKKIDVWVKNLSGKNLNTELSAGKIRLTTKDGLVCKPTDTFCISSKQQLKGKIKLTVSFKASNNQIDNNLLAGDTRVLLYRGYQVEGTIVDTLKVTDAKGEVTLKNLDYDSYTIKVIKQGFIPSIRYVDLQSPKLHMDTIILDPLMGYHDIKVAAYMNEPMIDFDLFVELRSDKGYSCSASPYNKYCGYAISSNDVTIGVGEQTVLIKNLAVANYLAYLAPADPYKDTCKYAHPLKNKHSHYQAVASSLEASSKFNGTWDWSNVKTTKPLSTLDISTFTFVRGEDVALDLKGRVISDMPENVPAEGKKHSKIPKKLLSTNGTLVKENIVTDTNFVEKTDIFGRITTNPEKAVEQLGEQKYLTPTVTNGEVPHNPEETSTPETIPEASHAPVGELNGEKSKNPQVNEESSNGNWLDDDNSGTSEASTRVIEGSTSTESKKKKKKKNSNEDSKRNPQMEMDPNGPLTEEQKQLYDESDTQGTVNDKFSTQDATGPSKPISSSPPEEEVYDEPYPKGISHISRSTTSTIYSNQSTEIAKYIFNKTELNNGTVHLTNSTLINITDHSGIVWKSISAHKVTQDGLTLVGIFDQSMSESRGKGGVININKASDSVRIYPDHNGTKSSHHIFFKKDGVDIGKELVDCEETKYRNGSAPMKMCNSVVEMNPPDPREISESRYNTIIESTNPLTGNAIEKSSEKTVTDFKNGTSLTVTTERVDIKKTDGRNSSTLNTKSVFGPGVGGSNIVSEVDIRIADHKNGSIENVKHSVYEHTKSSGLISLYNVSKVELQGLDNKYNESWIDRTETAYNNDTNHSTFLNFSKHKYATKDEGKIDARVLRKTYMQDGREINTMSTENTEYIKNYTTGVRTSFNQTFEANQTHFKNHESGLLFTSNENHKNTSLVRDIDTKDIKLKKVSIRGDLTGKFLNDSTVNKEFNYIHWGIRNQNHSWNNLTEIKELYYVCHEDVPCNSTKRHFEERLDGEKVRNTIELIKSDSIDEEGTYSILENNKNFLYGEDLNSSSTKIFKNKLTTGFITVNETHSGVQKFNNSQIKQEINMNKFRFATTAGPNAAYLKRSEVYREENATWMEFPMKINKSETYQMDFSENIDGSLSNKTRYYEMIFTDPELKGHKNNTYTFTFEYTFGPKNAKNTKEVTTYNANAFKQLVVNDSSRPDVLTFESNETQLTDTSKSGSLTIVNLTVINTTAFTNGSVLVEKEIVHHLINKEENLETSSVNSTQIWQNSKNHEPLTWTYKKYKIVDGKKTLLSEESYPSAEDRRKNLRRRLQGTNLVAESETDPTDTGNYVWISCFTGYGYSSVIEFNKITVNRPTLDDCIKIMNEERPDYTIEKLRAEMQLLESKP